MIKQHTDRLKPNNRPFAVFASAALLVGALAGCQKESKGELPLSKQSKPVEGLYYSAQANSNNVSVGDHFIIGERMRYAKIEVIGISGDNVNLRVTAPKEGIRYGKTTLFQVGQDLQLSRERAKQFLSSEGREDKIKVLMQVFRFEEIQ